MKASNVYLTMMSILLVVMSTVSADAPRLLNYQGRLTNLAGAPLTGSYSMTFRIYDAAAGGNLAWSETYPAVAVNGGLFEVLLGSVTQLYDTTFADTARWMGLQVGTDPELTPRTRLATSAYSFRTASVDGASGGTITSKVSIGPGNSNTGIEAFVVGQSNSASGNNSTVGGGISNIASGTAATVSGGNGNVAGGDYAAVGGGTINQASGFLVAVGGGTNNTASGDFANIGGGSSNTANGESSVVGGGTGNIASGMLATVGGGELNIASNLHSTVPGGTENTASGVASFAAGKSAKALHKGTFVWSSGADVTSTGVDQFLISAPGGVGIGTTSPTAQLEVVGDLKVSGNIETSGSIIGSTPWTDFPFAAGYNNYEDVHPGDSHQRVQYRKIGDVVHIRGIIHKANHAVIPANELIGTLPVGFRPPGIAAFEHAPSPNGVLIYPTGEVKASYTSAHEYQFLDGTCFSTTP